MKVKMTCLSCGSKYILKLDKEQVKNIVETLYLPKSGESRYACGECDSKELSIEEMENKDA